MNYEAVRYHDISCGHRVAGHENKCRHLHGHNYRVHFHCAAQATESKLDTLGRVIDFSVIKERLCMWLENHWDHKTLIWDKDVEFLDAVCVSGAGETTRIRDAWSPLFAESVVLVPFNPTAENMADYLLVLSDGLLAGTGVEVRKVVIEETRKCSVAVERSV